jgi:hypothetical protein
MERGCSGMEESVKDAGTAHRDQEPRAEGMTVAREPWLFPELSPSFKQVFVIQMVFTSIGVGVAWSNFGANVGVICLVIVGLVWCGMIQSGISRARHERISNEVQDRLAEQRSSFHDREERIFSREESEPMPPPPAPTIEMNPADYGRG